jgi:hypothetical protein
MQTKEKTIDFLLENKEKIEKQEKKDYHLTDNVEDVMNMNTKIVGINYS